MKYTFCIIFSTLFIQYQLFAQTQEFSTFDIAEAELKAARPFFEHQTGNRMASADFDVNYYRCVWEVDPAVKYITGAVTSYFTITSGTSSITWDLDDHLTVDSVIYNGHQTTYNMAADELRVDFPGALPAGRLDSMTIYYRGVPFEDGSGAFVRTTHSGTPIIWTLSEPYGSKMWWPCKTDLGDKADSLDVILIYPDIYKGTSNGIKVAETTAGGKTTVHWKHRYPITSYLVAFAVTNYQVQQASVQLGNINLPMETYVYPESATQFSNGTTRVLECMTLFHNEIDDYPFITEKYGHTQISYGGGMEHQTNSFIGSASVNLMSHELAHQWFGNKVTCKTWQDIWLNEGFATYFARYFDEITFPSTKIDRRRQVVTNITLAPGGRLKVVDTTNINQIFSGRISYNKGSYVVQMLKWILGEQPFMQAIKNYLNDPRLVYGYATTNDLKQHLQSVSGKNLDYFFTQWFEGQGYPSYDLKWSDIGNGTIRAELFQSTSLPADIEFFALPVPVLFRNATTEKMVVFDNTNNGQVFFETLGFAPDTAFIDPNYEIISRDNTTEKTAFVNTGASGITVYPNPSAGPVNVVFDNFLDAEIRLSVFNVLGQQVYKTAYAIPNGFGQLTLPDWSKGMYILRFEHGTKKVVRKILKQ